MGQVVAAIPIITALVGAGAAAYGAINQPKTPKIDAPPPTTEIENLIETDEQKRRKRASRSSTLLTQPGSLNDTATYRPTLLGQ